MGPEACDKQTQHSQVPDRALLERHFVKLFGTLNTDGVSPALLRLRLSERRQIRSHSCIPTEIL